MNDATAPDRLVIVDPTFQGAGGHHLSTNLLLAEAAAAADLSTVLVCHRNFESTDFQHLDVEVLPMLHHDIYHQYESGDSLALSRLNAAAYEGFSQIPSDVLSGASIFLHTTNETEIQGFSRFVLDRLTAGQNARWTIGIMYPPGVGRGEVFDLATAKVYQQALAPLISRREVSVCGIGESIAEDLEALLGHRVGVLPPPFALPASSGGERPGDGEDPEDLTLFFVGDARSDKGFHLVPKTMRILLAAGAATRFVVQVPQNPSATQAMFVRQLEVLQDSYPSQVLLYSGRVDDATYEGWWSQASLCCLFYDQRQYRYQTSGICWEAMASAVPVVTAPGLWHATELRRYGFDVVEAATYWPESLAEAVVEARSRLAELRETATAQSAIFLEKNPLSSFADTALGGPARVLQQQVPSAALVLPEPIVESTSPKEQRSVGTIRKGVATMQRLVGRSELPGQSKLRRKG